ncbi:TraR/DksA family transcriptional regulator [Gymnodinialimonas ulvae]|uniref:TraR/DksA family transcriptional regulator n=1 Tax=Gymnodinialimonas ulvae TaxID=3126504 RepID=UPI0030A42625
MRSDLKSRRKDLKDRLSVLSRRLAAETEPPEAEGPLTLSSNVSDIRAAELEVASIYAALRRMDDGSYGQCASCGADIAEARLDAFPFTSHCADCTPQAC